MNITKFSINHFMAVLVMSVGILLAGGSFYGDMPRENMPDVKIPFVIVTTSMTGANPTDVEISITTPLESTLEGIEGLKKLNSTSSEGVSVISLEFDPSLETEVVLSRVRDAVDKGKGDLPSDVKIPFVIVTTSMTGANPTDVEISITTPLETTLEGIEGLKKLNSTSSEGVSVISLEFDPSLETEVVLSRVRDAVDKGKGDLPSDVDAPIVKEFSLSGEVPVVVLSLVSGKNISLSQLQEMGDSIGDELERLPGVLDVKVRGGRDRMILIEVDPERMRYFKITLGQIQQMLTSTNRNVSAGASEGTINRIVMRAPGEFQTTEEIFNLVIGTSSRGTPVYMRDIATVSYSFENERSRARHYKFTTKDGETPINQYVPPEKSISIEIMKKSGDNLLALTEAVKKTIADLNLPKDVNIIVSLDQSKEVKMMLSDLENGIGTSLILVLMVIFVGLGARNAILVAVAIPFSMFLSIIILSALGFTLNMMVLYSLIMALGMLVDNAIVIVENIYRHYCLGETRIKAALTGTTEVAWPVIASTATTVGAFLPLVFWPGIMGSFMGFLPKTVIIVLLSSLFVALVINPTLCSLLMRRGKGAKSVAESDSERPTYPLVVFYARFLKHMLDRPIWTISTAGLILVFSIVLYGTFGAGVEFFPTLDPGSINANIKPPEGVSLDESDRMSKQMEDRIFGKPGSGYNTPVKNIKNVSVTIPLGVGPIKTRIQFVDRDYREGKTTASVSEIRNRIEGLDADGKQVTFPLYDAEYDVVTPSDGPSSGKPISVDIYGQDLNQMTHVIRDMKQFMTKTEGVAKPTDNAATAQPTLEWKIDRARAGMFGLNQSTVSSYLKLAVGGVRSGSFGHGDDEQDILFRVPQIPTQSATQLKNITIPTPGGGSIPITSIASATLVPGPVAIKHGERQRVLNAGAELQPWVKADADVRASFQKKVKQYSFPPGITYSFGGAAEDQQESTEFLQFAFITALFLMAIVLVIQFNSIFVPMIIFASIILSLVGVFAGLLIFDMPFGIIMSGIGVISLAGVVVNNAIVLLDAIRQMQNKGHELYDAVITAGMIRFRPVLLTAITTIQGLAPMAFKINIDFANLTYQYDTDSSQYWQSMAVAIIFGLFLSTILTLGVVPTLYVIYDRSKSWISGKWPGENSEDLMQKAG